MGRQTHAESGSDRDSEDPVDEHNHALSALRYLIASIDRGRQALSRPSAPQLAASPGKRPWLHWTNSALYTRIW